VEDFVISMRALEQGYLVRSEPEARAKDPHCVSNREEMTRKIRIGAGGYQALGLLHRLLRPQYGMRSFAFWGHKALRWMVPFFMLASLISNVALIHLSFYRNCFYLQVGGILISALAYLLPPGKKLPKWTRPISYFYLMNFSLFRGFWRFLFRTQRVTWDRAEQGQISLSS
jgi:hypothetical protein